MICVCPGFSLGKVAGVQEQAGGAAALGKCVLSFPEFLCGSEQEHGAATGRELRIYQVFTITM